MEYVGLQLVPQPHPGGQQLVSLDLGDLDGLQDNSSEDMGARLDCSKYLFYPGCRGSSYKRSVKQEQELGQELGQELDQEQGRKITRMRRGEVVKRGQKVQRGGLFSSILR